MGTENLKIDLDPKAVLAALKDISEGSKKLAVDIENSLGKDSVKQIDKLEETAKKGTTRITTFFKNMGTRIKEDLKTAFDVGAVLEGAKFARGLGEGTRQVFEMERAFSKLNTRLQLSNKEMEKFKTQVGKRIAATGQKLEDILPGVETAAAKGGIKSPEQLSAIGEMLAQVRSATGEDTGALMDTVTEILKNQGKKITASNIQSTLDALQATRVQGAFKTAGEAGKEVEEMSKYSKHLGIGTREMGGLAATASGAGEGGLNILQQLLAQGSTIGGQQQMNAVLGVNLFKNGKLDATQLSKVNTEKFGKYSPQIMEQATGLSGASGQDFKRFVEAFKNNTAAFKNVLSGSNETASQFEIATDNLATSTDRFKEKTKEAGREIGGSLSKLGKDILSGNFKDLKSDAMDVGKKVWQNKEVAGAALAVTGIVGAISGGALGRLFKKVGGGGLAGGVATGAALKEAAGVQPVFVVNAADIGGGLGGGMLGAGGMGGLKTLAMGLGIGTAAVGVGYGAAKLGEYATEKGVPSAGDQYGFLKEHVGEGTADVAESIGNFLAMANNTLFGTNYSMNKGGKPEVALTPEVLEKSVQKGTEAAHKNNKPTVQLSNPSDVTGRGRGM